MTDLATQLKQGAIRGELEEHRKRRVELEQRLEQERALLADLIVKGKTAGLGVRAMAELAGIGRERAYELVRGKVRNYTRSGRPRKTTTGG